MKELKHRRAIVIPDIHFPYQDDAAINCVLEAIKMVKPNICIQLGDIGEWESVSGWRYSRRKRPPLEFILMELDVEAELVNEGLDLFDKALKDVGCVNKYMLEGNHDVWLQNFVDEFPYIPQYKFKNLCKLDDRGYKLYPYGKLLRIGKLFFYHGGHYTTMYHTKQHAINLGKNIVYGHMHDAQRIGVTHVDGAHHAFSLGCLKDMSSEKNLWLKRRQVNWSHNFGIVDWFSDGNFRLDVVDIQKGKTYLWGNMIDGNKKTSTGG